MKAILQSIKPQYCELIAAGKKTIEVRKTKPKLQPPFKCYVYCTQDAKYKRGEFAFSNILPSMKNLQGKIIGEFICDNIYEYEAEFTNDEDCYNDIRQVWDNEDCEYEKEKEKEFKILTSNESENPDNCLFCEFTRLSFNDVKNYVFNGTDGYFTFYGLHITKFKLYDTPKEISDFFVLDKEYIKKCPYRVKTYHNPDFTNGAMLPGGYACNNSFELAFCRGQCEGAKKPLTRPPQSWCYVEEV